jgi:eukaryotic translation initiation factor 2C
LFFRVGRNLDDATKRMRRQPRSKTFKVEISYVTKIPLKAITNAIQGQESEHYQEALRVLDIILRQNAAKQYVQIKNFSLYILFLL